MIHGLLSELGAIVYAWKEVLGVSTKDSGIKQDVTGIEASPKQNK